MSEEELKILHMLAKKFEEQYIEDAKDIEQYKNDREEYHIMWDEFISKILADAGFKKIAKMYDNAPGFWYS